MSKKVHHSPCDSKYFFAAKNSEDESSDSDSLGTSCKSFAAVPQQFRPDLHTHSKSTERTPKCLLGEERGLPLYKSTSAAVNTSGDTVSQFKRSPCPFECKQLFSTNAPVRTDTHVYEEDNCLTSKKDQSLGKCLQTTNIVATKAKTKDKAIVGKTTNKSIKTSYRMGKGALRSKRPNRNNSKETTLKYECTEKRERETIFLNFEIPLTNATNDLSDSDQDQIEWTVIKEKNTVSTTKTQLRNQLGKKKKNENLSKSREVKKPNEHYRQNKSNTMQIKANKSDECNKSKITIKPTEVNQQKNFAMLDNFLLNDFKNIHVDSRNADSENEFSYLNGVSFQEKVKIKPCNFTSEAAVKNISKDLQNCDKNKHSNEKKMFEPAKADCKNDLGISQNQDFEHNERKNEETAKEIEELRTSILFYGQEMSDLIIGSHAALSMFMSFYKEWIQSRLQLISHFENLEKNLKESSGKFTKYKDIIHLAQNGASIAAAIPLPHVSVAAKIISVLTSLFSAFVSASEKKNSEIENSSDITAAVFRDTQASSDLYMYGLQCHQQFQETIKLIEEFHSKIKTPHVFKNESPEIATFLQGVIEYKPNHRIFYKKLHKCFRELLQNNVSTLSKRFCEPFTFSPSDAVDVIGFLDWRFRCEDFNSQSVRYELEQIHQMIESVDSISIKNLVIRIRSCINFLRDELTFVEGCAKHISLFNDSDGFSKTF